MTDFSGAFAVFMFDKNNAYPDAHEQLIDIYSEEIDIKQLLVGDDIANGVVVDDPVPTIKNVISSLMADLAVTTPGSDASDRRAVIRPKLELSTVAMRVGDGLPIRRVTKLSLTNALSASKTESKTLFIKIGINHLHFETDGQTYTDWSDSMINTSRFAAPAPAPSSGASVPSIATLSAAFAAAMSTTPPAAAPPASAPAPASTFSGPSTSFTFNVSTLPPDVQTRYQNKQDGIPVTMSETASPFLSGYRYHYSPPDTFLICLDGTLFIDRGTYEEKNFIKVTLPLTDESHSGIRQWYETFLGHCMDHGIYAHPFYCYRRDVGKWGFTCGTTTDDDLPNKFKLALTTWSGIIWRYLAVEKIVEKNSKLRYIVNTCNGDGYAALKSILYPSHPIFHDTPSVLIQEYPKMSNKESTLQYWALFQDFLRLQAFIMDTACSLDQKQFMDIFIANHKFGKYIVRKTSEERRSTDVNLLRKYRASTIVETIDELLLRDDAPRETHKKTVTNYVNTFPRQQKPIRHIAADEFKSFLDDDDAQPSSSSPGQDFSNDSSFPADDSKHDPEDSFGDDLPQIYKQLNQLSVAADKLSVPETQQAKNVYEVYKVGIRSVQRDPAKAFAGPCVVCTGPHGFADCKILQDTEFLRSHYIRYCTALQREQRARAAAFPQATRVNFVSTSRSHSQNEYDADIDADDRRAPQKDFLRGPR